MYLIASIVAVAYLAGASAIIPTMKVQTPDPNRQLTRGMTITE